MSKEYDEKLHQSSDADLESCPPDAASVEEIDEEVELQRELEEEQDHDIKYRSCSWQKTAMLLSSEYICLAAMSFPWSFSVLGIVPGLILTVGLAVTCLYTGLIIGDYCVKYPKMQSICDIGQHLFWGSKWAYWATVVGFLLSNTMIQSLHALVGAKYLNTVSNHGACTIVFSVVTVIICFLVSLPRTFSHMSSIALFSSATMLIAFILGLVFAGIQDHPYGYDPSVPVHWNLWPEKGTTYVQGMNAMLNILFTLAGQASYPSFISEMKQPKDFKKALYLVTALELVIYCVVGSIVYVYSGNAYIAAPSFGSLTRKYKIIAFSFTVPTIIFLGSLFSNISAQFVFKKVFCRDSVHRTSHTATGWAVWTAVNLFAWIVAFVIAQVIPFFSDLLSLMSSLFAAWFGYIFWGVAYFRLKQVKYSGQFTTHRGFYTLLTTLEKVEYWCCWGVIVIGLYLIGPGTYASVESIILNYQARAYGDVFTCASNAI